MHTPIRYITVFGLGSMRPAPGTWGSLPPIVVASGLFCVGLEPRASGAGPWVYLGAIGVVLLFGCLACILEGDRAEARWGKDPSHAVADETAGQCLPLLALPLTAEADWRRVTITLAAAFLLFRLMDIAKPPPAYRLQKLPAGWGILIDDLIAGVYAAFALQLLRLWH
jgi:phosphatidylglycerophosphatase A